MGMEERIMIFVDGSNFYFGLKEMFRRYPEIEKGLDYYKLAKILSHNRKLIRIYYYIGQVQEKDDPVRYRSQQKYLTHIQQTQLCALRLGKLLRRGTTFTEKGVDVMLVTDLLRLARLNSYDTAILISGDGDFVSAIKEVQDMGKQVELAYFPLQNSFDLRNISDRYRELTPVLLKLCSLKTLPEVINVNRPGIKVAVA